MIQLLAVYLRVVLYLLAAFILILFTGLHKDRSRRLRNLSLSIFFLTIVVSLIVRLASGLAAQGWVNDFVTTPALIFYVVMLCIDFYFASVANSRERQ
jgi:hypothetical protein